MSEKLLNSPNIIIRLQKVCGKAMAKRMYAYRLSDSSDPNCLLDCPLQTVLADMVASYHPGAGISRPIPGREHVLPCPFEARLGILSFQRIGQIDAPVTFG